MELRQFTYVNKVAELGSITKAAAALFISQPALSNYINMAPFKKQYPEIEVIVVSGPGNHLVEQLRVGDVDFVMLPAWNKQKDIVQVEMSKEELVLVAARGYLKREHLLDGEQRIVNWREVARLPLITLYKGHALRSSVEVLYRNAGLKPDIFMESHSNMLSYRLAAQGLGVAVVPEITLEMMKGSMEAETFHLARIPVTWEVQALYREGCYIGEAEQALLDITRRVLREHKAKASLV